MSESKTDPLWSLLGLLFKAHPWHGVPIGGDMPEKVTVYVEIVPTDTVKYELDKHTGHLRVDRPQRFSNVCPAVYGLLPQTFCGERTAEPCARAAGVSEVHGDSDPLDICVLTEKTISHGDVLLQAIPIGGLRMLDDNQADDKIIAVLESDSAYGGWRDLSDCPKAILDRLQHYFLTYKDSPASKRLKVKIVETYGREAAHDVIRRSHEDYKTRFAGIQDLLTAVLRG